MADSGGKFRKLKIYLHYDSASGHQTWQAGDLPWESFTYNVAPLFGHMVFWDHVTI